MAFIGKGTKGSVYAPGYILAYNDDNVTRVTKEIPDSLATVAEDGTKYVKMGTPFPANDSTCVGLLYEDVDVTVGNMPGSVIVANAEVYEDRLPVALDSDAKAALVAAGFKFVSSAPAVVRPY